MFVCVALMEGSGCCSVRSNGKIGPVALKFQHGGRELSVAFDHPHSSDGRVYELTLLNVMNYPVEGGDGIDLGRPTDQEFAEILGRFLSGSVSDHEQQPVRCCCRKPG